MTPDVFSSFSPRRALLVNALVTRALPWTFSLAGQACSLNMGRAEAPFETACRLYVKTGDSMWRLELGSLAPLGLHPELVREAEGEPGHGSTPRPDDEAFYSTLPEELRLAVLETLFAPVLEQAAIGLETTVRFVDEPSRTPDAKEEAGPAWIESLPLTLTLPWGGASGTVPLRLFYSDPASARYVTERLNDLPVRRASPDLLASLPVDCGLEAGQMALSLAELHNLEPGDVLLPESWHPDTPHLRLPDGSLFACRAVSGQAEIIGAIPSTFAENSMNQDTMNQSETPVASPSETRGDATHDRADGAQADAVESADKPGDPLHVNVDALEMTLRFELERLSLTVGDLASLAAGYTFALGGDPLSPVTLRVGDVVVGTGRLVDLNGMPGVQLTRILPVPSATSFAPGQVSAQETE